jgi:hypothetical protein
LQGNRTRSKGFEQINTVRELHNMSDKVTALVYVFTHHWRATFRKPPMVHLVMDR